MLTSSGTPPLGISTLQIAVAPSAAPARRPRRRGRPIPPAELVTEARTLVELGFTMAAACLLRAALESRLTALCDRHGLVIYVQGDDVLPRMHRYVRALARRRVIDRPTASRINKIVTYTNRAAHGRTVTAAAVARMLEKVAPFITETEVPQL